MNVQRINITKNRCIVQYTPFPASGNTDTFKFYDITFFLEGFLSWSDYFTYFNLLDSNDQISFFLYRNNISMS